MKQRGSKLAQERVVRIIRSGSVDEIYGIPLASESRRFRTKRLQSQMAPESKSRQLHMQDNYTYTQESCFTGQAHINEHIKMRTIISTINVPRTE